MTTRKLVGHCGVDSGLIFIGDPCYFKHCEAFCDPDKWTENKQIFPVDKDGNNRQSNLPMQFYSDEKVAGGHTFPMGILTNTNYGDGEYPVYVTFDKDGSPTKLEIKFT